MGPLEAVAILLAGIAAGSINAVVGSGTLVTFPTLLAFGIPPVTANVSNTVGLFPGSFSAAWGYRRELRGQRRRVLRLTVASVIGGTVGALLLLVLPEEAFAAIVPALVALGVVLVIAQPSISRRVAARRALLERREDPRPHGSWWVWPAVLGTGVYGGYFGAAQGVLLMGVLGIGVEEDLQRLNAVKNVLAGAVNAVAAAVFVVVAHVDWSVAATIAVGAVVGGQLGALVGRRLPPVVLRAVIVLVGTTAFVVLVAG